MDLQKYCFTLQLKNEETLLAEYDQHHTAVWPEVIESFREAGILHIEMYRTGTSVVMIFEVDEQFTFEKKDAIDRSNPVIQQWENLMSSYQQSVPGTLAGEKWKLMKKIFTYQNPDY